MNSTSQNTRKIIHIDADCFYAAVETRDNPALKGKPIAVGGSATRRGVIATANYEARKFGIHSAMASATAMKRCPQLILIPGRMSVYREASRQMHEIFADYTDLIEPLSLDEAFLDVSAWSRCRGSATLIAREIRQRIAARVGITVSAGVASNKFITKVASDWNKPNGQHVVTPQQSDDFLADLPKKKSGASARLPHSDSNNRASRPALTCALSIFFSLCSSSASSANTFTSWRMASTNARLFPSGAVNRPVSSILTIRTCRTLPVAGRSYRS